MIFASLALLVAMGALVTAGIAYSRSNDAKRSVDKVAVGGAIGSIATVKLQEFGISVSPGVVKAGRVTFDVSNIGGITHELVIVRAPSVPALPIVTVAGERSVGAVDEEAIPETDKVGESGDVKVQGHVTKRFMMKPGSYVVFCNIDNINKDKTVTNHFVKGMHATLTVV